MKKSLIITVLINLFVCFLTLAQSSKIKEFQFVTFNHPKYKTFSSYLANNIKTREIIDEINMEHLLITLVRFQINNNGTVEDIQVFLCNSALLKERIIEAVSESSGYWKYNNAIDNENIAKVMYIPITYSMSDHIDKSTLTAYQDFLIKYIHQVWPKCKNQNTCMISESVNYYVTPPIR